MIFDLLAESDGRLETVRELVERGELELVETHVQRDEHSRITDPEKRARVRSVPTRSTPTWGFVLGTSRLGEARLGPAEPIEGVCRGNLDHAEDALIASTALFDGCTLVTNDRRLTNRARKLGVDVWSGDQLLAYLKTA
jgi:hypothetical protein